MTTLAYLRQEMGGFGNFISDYRGLSVEDKAVLQKWVAEEMAALGIAVSTGPSPAAAAGQSSGE